ncbi:non-ribosomal peptide synthetase [Shewanella salipaludis]|uniref:non-ribosomal peptide synthetase n=1 Tax=Shewanella salipaludis TaxID=2723052 RepID=UPI001B7CFFE4
MQQTSPALARQPMLELPLVGPQLGIWLAEQISPVQNLFSVAQYVVIEGSIDIDLLQRAIQIGLSEADTVHSQYRLGSERPLQLIPPLPAAGDIGLPSLIDLSNEAEAEAQAHGLMAQDLAEAGNAADSRQLYRHLLIKLPSAHGGPRWFWYQRYHHLMVDGFSFSALTQRIAQHYTALKQGRALAAAALTPYAAVVEEYQAYAGSDKYQSDKQFWLNYAANLVQPISLSRMSGPAKLQSGRVLRQEALIPSLGALVAGLEDPRVSKADTAIAIVLLYLGKMTGQTQISCGFPFMRRMGSVALSSSGCVVNVLPLQITLESGMRLADVVRALTWEIRKLRKHQGYEAEQIKRDLGIVGSQRALYGPSINCKLFDYRLNFDTHTGTSHQLATGPIEDMEFGLYLNADELRLELAANADRYQQAELALHCARLQHICAQLQQDPQLTLARLSVLSPDELAQLQAWQQGPRRDSSGDPASVLTLLSRQVAARAQCPALVFQEQRFSFQALSERINRLSRFLLALGVTDGKLVATALPRSAESVIAIFAILQTGAAYLPLDLSHPDERLKMICDDAMPALVLTHSQVIARLPGDLRRVSLDEQHLIRACAGLSAAPIAPEEFGSAIEKHQLAYVFYTSGSTGKPKGVKVPHGALVNLMMALQQEHYTAALAAHEARSMAQGLAAGAAPAQLRVALTGSFSFDTSWDPLLQMLLGNTLYLFDEDIKRDVYALLEAIDRHRIDTLAVAPSLATQLMAAGMMERAWQPLLLNICGEAVSPALWHSLQQYPQLHAYNIYGPTEFTVYATSARVSPGNAMPTIGRPLANTCAYVLDHELQTVPIGVTGELYLAGDNMSLGYLNRPAGSASRFVANPFVSGQRMYLSGDLVRWDPQGHLEFIGRSDNQVKIRGFRIELGEVEAALSALAAVKEVAVIVQPHAQGQRLLGYCTLKPPFNDQDPTLVQQSLMAQLSERLPDYMLPSRLTLLADLPLTVSGKIDKQALPTPMPEPMPASRAAAAVPTTAEEWLICRQMAETLGLERVGLDDDFFNLGGDSIGAMQLSIRLNRQGVELKPRDIFAKRTPRGMLAVLRPLAPTEVKGNSLPPAALPGDAPRAGTQMNISAADRQALRARHGQIQAILPLLPLQQGLLFHAQLESQTSYSFTTKLDLSGRLDIARLRLALEALLDAYPQLSVIFDTQTSDSQLQLIPSSTATVAGQSYRWPWQASDLRALDAAAKAEALYRLEMSESRRSFDDVIRGKRASILAHAHLVRLGDAHYSLLLTAHHLIIDGWSTPILLQDLLKAYASGRAALMPPEVSYARVVSRLAARDLQPARDAWQEALRGVAPTLVFDQAGAVVPAGQPEVRELKLRLEASLSEGLGRLCRRQGLTLNTLMQGVWALLLGSMTGRDDVVFGSPVSGRFSDIDGLEQHIGLFSNTLPVRIGLRPDISLLEQLSQIQQQQIALLEHDALGLGEIQRLAGTETLFDTLLVVENYPATQALLGADYAGLRLNDVQNRGFTHYPLTILVLPGDRIRILFEYRAEVPEPERLARRFVGLLEQLVRAPATPLCRLQLQTLDERDLLSRVNHTFSALPSHKGQTPTLRDLLQLQARKTPGQIALRDTDKALSYSEMRRQVRLLAEVLRANAVNAGDIIAIALPRSISLSLALQATIEAGAAYLPLDIGNPDSRLDFMLQDARPKLILTCQSQAARFSRIAAESAPIQVQILPIDSLLADIQGATPGRGAAAPLEAEPIGTLKASDPAYLIYTSGSTGRPKGVLVSHGAIVNRLAWMQHAYPLAHDDVILQKTPASFDVSVWEFFWPLLQGACLVMAPPEAHKDPALLLQLMEEYRVTTLHFVPSMLAAFLLHTETLAKEQAPRTGLGTGLRRVFCSGEALSAELAADYRRYYPAPLHNLYGPTEAAVDVTYFPATALPASAAPDIVRQGAGVPIGKPVWNTQVRVLDHQLREVGIGVSGELYLCGAQLAIGYLHRPALTAERFVASPFSAGERMYRTGDMVRWLPCGNLEYLGRSDDQLKIRGQRIEIGEIEQALLQLPSVQQAAVHARVLGGADVKAGAKTGDQRQLVGYVIADESGTDGQAATELELASLLTQVSRLLPAHMVPTVLMQVAAFPLSANGKLDRKALPDPRNHSNRMGRAPKPGMETRIAAAFAKLLGVNTVNAEDSFFNLGGHSLLAMQLATELRRSLQLQVSVGQIMVSPTVAELAAILGDEGLRADPDKAGFGQILPVRRGRGLPLVCINPGSGFSWQYTGLPKYLEGRWPIIGLQSPRPDGAVAVSADMTQAVQHYLELLKRVQPQGPYHFLGYSFGGTIAMALAATLTARGETVAFVGLLDTYPPEGQEWKRPTKEEAMAEVERERHQFLNAAEGDFADASSREEQTKMFNDILGNYDDTVRLLSQASTTAYSGRVELFVAEKSLPPGWDVAQSWAPYVGKLVQHGLPFAHDDILSAGSLTRLGPLLNAILAEVDTLGMEAQQERPDQD